MMTKGPALSNFFVQLHQLAIHVFNYYQSSFHFLKQLNEIEKKMVKTYMREAKNFEQIMSKLLTTD